MSNLSDQIERLEAGGGSAAWWILKAIKRLNDMPPGGVLEMVFSDTENISEHIKCLDKPGRKILGIKAMPGAILISIARTDEQPAFD